MDGNLYFALPKGTSGSGGGYECVDLRTGEIQWTVSNLTSMSFGQNLDFYSPNEFGLKSYLWQTGSTYNAYDPFTGAWLYAFANASTGTVTFGPSGELMVYILNGANNWLCLWNSSKAIMYYMLQPPTANQWMWRPQGLTMDWKYGIEWNVTTKAYHDPANQAIWKIDVASGVILASTYTGNSILPWMMEIGYSTADGRELWAVNRTAPFAGGMIGWVTLQAGAADGVFSEWYQEKMIWYGYDIKTGKQIWGPTEPYPNAWGMYSWQSRIAYGMLLAYDFGGYVHAYDIHTGKNLWNYFAGSAGYDTPYGIYSSEMPFFAADGKIYVTQGHGYTPPIFKGARLICINATDGTEMWSILQFNYRTGYAIADGYIAVYNNYDGQVYSFGKGPSATTVTAAPKVTALGSSVMIEGTVTDDVCRR